MAAREARGSPGTGACPKSLEGPSVEERKLEENMWLEQEAGERQQQPSHSPCPRHCLLLDPGHQQPRLGAPLKLTMAAGVAQGEFEWGQIVPCPHAPAPAALTAGSSSSGIPVAEQPCTPAGSVLGPAAVWRVVQGAAALAGGCCSCPASFRRGRPVSSRLPLPGRQPAGQIPDTRVVQARGGSLALPGPGSHPEGQALPPACPTWRGAKRPAGAPRRSAGSAPCPRPAACSSWRGSWLSGQSCLQHPPRMSPVSMSARSARHGTPRASSQHRSSPGACCAGGRGQSQPAPGAVGLSSIPRPSPGAGGSISCLELEALAVPGGRQPRRLPTPSTFALQRKPACAQTRRWKQ